MNDIRTLSTAKGYLETADVQRLAPSAFTDHAAPGVSSKYQFVNTGDILVTLAELGYVPVKAGQSVARAGGGHSYMKHVVRVMHKDYLANTMRAVGDVVPQIILTNSHNRTSAFHLSAGLFRLICSNGLAVETSAFTSVRVLHNDPAIHGHIIDGTNLIREITEKTVLPNVARMAKLELTADQVTEFAKAVTVLRYGEVNDAEAALLLEARRTEDDGRKMWQVLNRIQENVVRGGYATQDAAGRNVQARGIKSITRDLDFNVNLWNLGSRITDELLA